MYTTLSGSSLSPKCQRPLGDKSAPPPTGGWRKLTLPRMLTCAMVGLANVQIER